MNDDLTKRLLAGERVFLPNVDHADINGQSSAMYRAVKAAGLYLHMRQATHDGVDGLRVWADDNPRRKRVPEKRLSAIAVPVS